MRKIETNHKGWQKKVKKAMDQKTKFQIITADKEWKPNSNNPLDIAKWIWGSMLPSWVCALFAEKGIGLGAFAYDASMKPPDSPVDSAEKGAMVGAGGLILIGAGMILLAFFDPEPTSKLTLLVVGGITAMMGGGAILLFIILTRKKYKWSGSLDKKTGKITWTAEPVQ